MYGYSETVEITPNQLYTKVSQQQVFEMILGEEFNFFRKYRSPLREDRRPNCRFEERTDGTILFIDFGNKNGKTHITCLGMLMELERVDMNGAIKIICSYFNLPTNKTSYTDDALPYTYTNSRSYYKTVDDLEQSFVDITYTKQEYTRRDIIHWSGFLIRPHDLFEDNVFSVRHVILNNKYKKKVTRFHPISLCYAIDFLDAVKLYQPYNSDYKWITNCNENHIGNVDNLPAEGDKLIICKAYKDHRVFRNLSLGSSYNFIWFQNEGTIPTTDIILNLLSRFRQVIVFYDNDDKGIAESRKLAWFLNELKAASTIEKSIPTRYKYKDIGEFVNKEGRTDTINFLNEIQL